MVPAYIFSKEWREGNFLIPADKTFRIELRQKFELYSRIGIMFRPENAQVRTVLLARLAAIEAYDSVLAKAKRK